VQCAALRAAVNAAHMEYVDSVDGLLEHQLNLNFVQLGMIIGHDTTARLSRVAAACHADMSCPWPSARAALAAAGLPETAKLPAEPHEIFVRKYSAITRPVLALRA